MDDFPWCQFGHWCGRTTGGGNPCQAKVESRDNIAVLAPTATVGEGAIAQGDHLPFLNRDLIQDSFCENANPLPVRREERDLCSFSSWQLRGFDLIESPCEQLRMGYVHQPGTVGRENGIGSTVWAGRCVASQVDIQTHQRQEGRYPGPRAAPVIP